MNKRFWDIYAQNYDTATLNFSAYIDLLSKVAGELELKDSKIVNIGCGTGNLENYLKISTESFEWIGLDLSTSMLDRSKQKMKGDSRFSFQESDFNYELPVKDNYFDFGVMVHALYPAIDPKHSLSEAARVMRKGGRLVLVNPKNDASMSEMFKYEIQKKGWLKLIWVLFRALPAIIINLIIARMASKSDYHFLSKPEIMGILEEVGFNIVKLESVYAEQSFLIVAEKK